MIIQVFGQVFRKMMLLWGVSGLKVLRGDKKC